jgi:hypothetical protein
MARFVYPESDSNSETSVLRQKAFENAAEFKRHCTWTAQNNWRERFGDALFHALGISGGDF